MKKIIAVLVVFALIAGVAFAQSIGSGGAGKIELIRPVIDWGNGGRPDPDADPVTSWSSWWWISAKKTNDEGTMGAKGSLSISPKDGNKWDPTGDGYFYFWWQPIEQVFVKVGKTGEDGKYWAGAGIVGWDFQSNDLLMSPAHSWYNGFAGGVLGDSHGYFDTGLGDYAGLQISIIPIDGLTVNLGWKLDAGSFKDVFGDTIAAQVVYEIAGVGTAAVGFKNRAKGADKDIAVQWKMPIDAMKVELGLKFYVNPDIKDYKPPIDIGLGFGYGDVWNFDPGNFWVNARVGASIATADNGQTKIAVDVCPQYNLGIFQIYVPFGVGFVVQKNVDALFAWSFNPYIRKIVGSMEFLMGVQLYNGGYAGMGVSAATKDKVWWNVPVAFLWAW